MNILKTINVLGLIAVLALEPIFSQKAVAQPGLSVPIQTFYNELSPYGQWVPSPNYGSVWIPNVGQDFQPYATDGHWVVTEFGNTWVSDYPWGWAPFHYGRWYFDNQFGWAWIPGSDWGPAWVSWRTGGGYYGWAPLGPGLNINVNINIPAPYWTFVPQIYITSPQLYSYRVPRPNVVNIYQNTTIINNIYRSNNRAYVYGPPRGDIERITRQNVPIYRIDPMDRPGRSVVGNGSVGFYRPGQSSGYGQNYGGRNNQYDNSSRPNYNGNNSSGRGDYGGNNTPNRDYNNSNTPSRDYKSNNSPGRTYDGNTNAPNRDYNSNSTRGNYGNSAPADRSGTTAVPNSANTNASPSNRFEPSRGAYSPGNAQSQSGGYPQGNVNVQPGNSSNQQSNPSQQPTRTFDRSERQGAINSQPTQSGRGDGAGYQRMPDNNRAGQSQPTQPRAQEQPQPQRSNGGGERQQQQRGPR